MYQYQVKTEMNTDSYQVKLHTKVGCFVSIPLDGNAYRGLMKDIRTAQSAAASDYPESSLVFLTVEGLTTISPSLMKDVAYTIINLNPTRSLSGLGDK